MCSALVLVVALVLCPGTAKCGPDAERLAQVDQMYQHYRAGFEDVAEVTADTLQVWLARGDVVLVDVREPKEREVSVIGGAITRDQLADHLAEYTEKRVVVYCTIGYRSGKVTRVLEGKGIEACNLAGGILSWVHHGGVVEHGGKPTLRIHVYGRKWSLLPAAYEAVW